MEKFPQLLRKYFIFVIKNKHFVTTRNISNKCHVNSGCRSSQIHLSYLVMAYSSTDHTRSNNVKSGTMSKTVKTALKNRKIAASAPILILIITTLLQKPSDCQGINKKFLLTNILEYDIINN